jgi:hypothetical protein
MMYPTSRDERVVEARVHHILRSYLTPECPTYFSEFVFVARLTASVPAKMSCVSRVRISLRRTVNIFKTPPTTSRLQSAAKDLLCHD